MLSKKYRLLEGTRLNESITTPFFVIKTAKNEKAYSRFGFTVSKKIDKRAVVRNRIKRQVRSCVEQNLEKIKPGRDILFIIKKGAVGKETGTLCQTVLKEFEKNKFLNNALKKET